MRFGILLGALLLSACMSDPAFIGEGPGDATGGTSTGGASGTGSDSGTGGGNGTGLVGAGAGSALPPSGSCRITEPGPYENMTSSWIVSWDAERRVYSMNDTSWFVRFDEHGWMVEIAQPPESQSLFEYDPYGNITSNTYRWNGIENLTGSWDQTNDYDAEGRLSASHRVLREGDLIIDETFGYSGRLLTRRDRESDGPDGRFQDTVHFVREDGRIVRVDHEGGGVVNMRYTASYDAAGRLIEFETDFPSEINDLDDDVVDSRERWFYDDAGRVSRYEADGLDFTLADGVIDQWQSYEPACADIAVLPEFLYHMPVWLMPYARTGWNY